MEFKILLIGATEVGKTSLLSRYAGDLFDERFVSTVGIDFQVKNITWNDEDVKLQIWDTAGQERYRALTTAYYRGAKGFLLVFSLTNRKSFTTLNDWIEAIKESSGEDVPFVLVGNKCDLGDQRKVTSEEAQKYADSIGQEYFETSSKESININEVFEALLMKIIKEPENRPEKPQEKAEVEPISPKATITNEESKKSNEVNEATKKPGKHDSISKKNEEKKEKPEEGDKKIVEGDTQAKGDMKKNPPIRLEKEGKCEHAKHKHSFCSC